MRGKLAGVARGILIGRVKRDRRAAGAGMGTELGHGRRDTVPFFHPHQRGKRTFSLSTVKGCNTVPFHGG